MYNVQMDKIRRDTIINPLFRRHRMKNFDVRFHTFVIIIAMYSEVFYQDNGAKIVYLPMSIGVLMKGYLEMRMKRINFYFNYGVRKGIWAISPVTKNSLGHISPDIVFFTKKGARALFGRI